MPFSGVEVWRVYHGLFLAAALVSVVGTWTISILVLHIYRQRVHRGMWQRQGTPDQTEPSPVRSSSSDPAAITIRPIAQANRSHLLHRAGRGARRAQIILGLAGLLYGLAAVCVLFAFEGTPFTPIRVAALTLMYAWPVMPTVLGQLPEIGPLRATAVWVVYFAAVIALLILGGLSIGQIAYLVSYAVLEPALVVAATSARAVRGVSWLVAPALLLAGMAGMQFVFPVLYLLSGVFDRYAAVLLLGGMCCLLILVFYGFGLVQAYRLKLISDQTLLVAQWWFVAALVYTSYIVSAHGPVGVLGLLPFVVLCVVLVVGHRLVRRPVSQPARLLLLRTFGSRGRSTRLLRSLTRQWRWVGSVELVVAPDVATEVLEPDEFLDFLRGRLGLRFVSDRAALQRQLGSLDLAPDGDGLYRVNQFLCHVDGWKPVVEALIGGVDAVIIDLRGFGPANLGVVHEIERLVALVDLRRVIAVVDQSTDPAALQWALDRASANAPAWAPIRQGGSAVLQVVSGQQSVWQDPRPMVAAVFAAATPPSITTTP